MKLLTAGTEQGNYQLADHCIYSFFTVLFHRKRFQNEMEMDFRAGRDALKLIQEVHKVSFLIRCAAFQKQGKKKKHYGDR